MPFNIKFDINDYRDILPDPLKYCENDYVINDDEFRKGNIDNCIWKKHYPSAKEIGSPQFREREARRILKTGVWIAIKDEPIWIPPQLYFALQYGKGGSSDLQFRLKRLKHAYFKIRARNNPGCIGTLTVKNRGDGETTMAITDSFWECLDGNIDVGQIGIQSKTRNDAINPCWAYVKTLWQSLPQWVKDDLCSDFASGNNYEEKMKWERSADDSSGVKARNVLMTYYPSGTPMDGKHDMKKCVLDEICKWEESATFEEVFTNYSKFIMPGFERRGMFDMFSSPADKDCASNREVHTLWKNSNPDEITENGTTRSRIHRYYSDPLEGIHGAYDKYGDVDPQRIYDKIMADRAIKTPDKLLAEVRGFPLNEEEMFGSSDDGDYWDNHSGISKRVIYLLGTRFKNEKTKEPIVVRGNLEWIDGMIDNPKGVEFRQADTDKFDVEKARFSFSHLPKDMPELEMKYNDYVDSERIIPPHYIESCLGVDPYGKRYKGKRNSNGAGVIYKFLDAADTGIYKCPTGIYCNRPFHEDIFFEDMLKAAIFTRSLIQFENLNDRLGGYIEDRGYKPWLLVSIGEKKGSNRTGDAPNTAIVGATGTRTSFFDEGVRLLNALMNVPIKEGDPYWLERNWHIELLEDVLKLNPKDTHEQDLSMAWIQAVLGAVKILCRKIHKQSQFNNEFVGYFTDVV